MDNLSWKDVTLGVRVLAWWACVVFVIGVTWPVLGLVLTIVSTGLFHRNAELDVTVNYCEVAVKVAPWYEHSDNPGPVMYLALWLVFGGLWVGFLLIALGYGQ